MLILLNLTKFFIKFDTKNINFLVFWKMILGSKISDMNKIRFQLQYSSEIKLVLSFGI